MKNPRIYVGLDTHKSFSYATALTESGEVIRQAKLANFSREFFDFFDALAKRTKLTIAIECSEMIMPFVKSLERYGEVKAAHPTKLKLVAEARIKTDRISSTAIANLARLNYLPESYIPREEIRKLRNLCRERYALKTIAARIKIQIRHCLLSHGIITEENVFTKEGRERLEVLNIAAIRRRLELLELLEEKIEEINEDIRDAVVGIEAVELLTTIPGIGLYSASLLYSEIADIKRFASASKLASYAGLVPSLHQSGNKRWFGRITKQGNKLMRWVLIQCAHVAVRTDPELRAYFERLSKEKGKRKAIVAVARKLLRRVYALWKRKGAYEDRGSV